MTTSPPANGRFSPDIRLSGLGLRLREWPDADLPGWSTCSTRRRSTVGPRCATRSTWPLPASYLNVARARRAENRNIQLAITTDGHTARGEILLYHAGPGGRGPDGRRAEQAYAIGAAQNWDNA